ncbi:MAG: DUF2442 domain-containing protein [Pseudomonadota bacterium]
MIDTIPDEMKSIKRVISGDDLTLILEFESGEIRFIDMKPFIGGDTWGELKDPKMFNTVKVDDLGGLEWDNGLTYCPDSAFMDSTDVPLQVLRALIDAYQEHRQRLDGTGTEDWT